MERDDGRWGRYQPPKWYALIKAAQFLGVEPWELERQPSFWRDRALLVRQAEIDSKDQQERMLEQFRQGK